MATFRAKMAQEKKGTILNSKEDSYGLFAEKFRKLLPFQCMEVSIHEQVETYSYSLLVKVGNNFTCVSSKF